MAENDSTGTTAPARPVAWIVMTGAQAQSFRRETLFEYAETADRINSAVGTQNPVDVESLHRERQRLTHLGAILDQLGWDREIDLAEDVEIGGPSDTLAETVRTFIATKAEHLQAVAQDYDNQGMLAVEDAFSEVQDWRDRLAQIRNVVGADA